MYTTLFKRLVQANNSLNHITNIFKAIQKEKIFQPFLRYSLTDWHSNFYYKT